MKNKLKNYRKKSLITSVCLLITILIISCSTSKKTTSSYSQENVRQEKTVDSAVTKRVLKEVTAQAVPTEQAQVSVLIGAVSSLPEGAKFTGKNGRASVELLRTGDTIIITAICDSLQQQIYNYELEITNYEKKIEQKNNEIKTL
ncbi:MAG: hypothetical protein LBT27_06570, partial [Prevotellaceae bacterium]|nr:hypothetical protein [Prevotellaceae bacterium]